MKAVVLTGFDSPPALTEDLEAPAPAEDQVLVRVHASSANPVDNAIAAGMLQGMVDHRFPIVLGRDYAGVVERVGPGAGRYEAGDEVYGFLPYANPAVGEGSWAERILVSEDASARVPAGLDLARAGAAPLAGITAMLCLDALGLSAGETLLIVGAAGGVGSFAAQLAAHRGATVIAPALAEDEEYLRGLGVGEVIDRNADLAAAVRERLPDGVDALLDLVSSSPDAFEATAAALRSGGRGASPNFAAGDGPGRANVLGASTTENLERLGRLLADGAVTVPIQSSYGLDRAADALRDLGTTHTQGKLAIRVA